VGLKREAFQRSCLEFERVLRAERESGVAGELAHPGEAYLADVKPL